MKAAGTLLSARTALHTHLVWASFRTPPTRAASFQRTEPVENDIRSSCTRGQLEYIDSSTEMASWFRGNEGSEYVSRIPSQRCVFRYSSSFYLRAKTNMSICSYFLTGWHIRHPTHGRHVPSQVLRLIDWNRQKIPFFSKSPAHVSSTIPSKLCHVQRRRATCSRECARYAVCTGVLVR